MEGTHTHNTHTHRVEYCLRWQLCEQLCVCWTGLTHFNYTSVTGWHISVTLSVCIYICICSVCCAAPLGEQVAVEDVEQHHGHTVEEQEICGQQRGEGRWRRRWGVAGGLFLRCAPPLRGQKGRHAAQHSGQLTQKHIRAHTHVLLDKIERDTHTHTHRGGKYK